MSDADGFDDVDELDDDAGNRIVGATPRNVLEFLAKQIVDEPEAVVVESSESRRGVDLRLSVAPDDIGKIIGKRGRVAQSIRTVVRAAAVRDGADVDVEFLD